MKLLLKLQNLKLLWTLKPPNRTFHGHPRLLSSDVYSQYESIRQGKQEIPKYFNFASDVLDKWSEIEKAGKRPSNPAFWWINGEGEEVKWSFEELGFLSRKVANVLTKECGLQKGDRLILILPRIPEWWLVKVACMRAGIVIIPGTSQLSAKDILYRLQASKAKCIITTDKLAPAVDSAASQCQLLKTKLMVSKGSREGWLNFTELYLNQSADHSCIKTRIQDPMIIFFTSGTTGSPKMTQHSQGSLGFRPLLSERYWLDLTPSHMIWNTADTGWILTSIASFFDPWVFGSCIFIHNLPQTDSEVILNTLCRFPIDALVGAPTLFRMLVQNDLSKYKFMKLKYCVSGGEPLNPEVMEQWKSQTGLDIHEVYGQTEMGVICSVFKGMKIKPGSMGKAAPLYDVQIIDKNANILPPGQQGEIAIRSKPIRPLGFFSEYLDNPKKTAESERGDFYVTGDRGTMDEEGYFQFIGRNDDIIISSGYRIGPFEVESALIEHPAVVETAVVSSPDPLRGEVVKAFVVLSPTFSSTDLKSLIRDLQDHVKKTTAPYKYPRKVEFVKELPKTVTGKIKRNELRDKESRNGKGDEIKRNFEELGFMSQKVVNVLSGPGNLQRGDQVLVILPRIPGWWQLSMACIQTGVIITPGTTQLTASDICYQLLALKARCVIIIHAVAPLVDSVASKCQSLKTKLIVSESSRAEWLNFSHLFNCDPQERQVTTGKHRGCEIGLFLEEIIFKFLKPI